MSKTGVLWLVVVLAGASACTVDMRDKDSRSLDFADAPNVVGTYVAQDSGTTLGKHWCYSGALVLDSTRHFGSVITMCSDDGSPGQKSINGSYRLRSVHSRSKLEDTTVHSLRVVLSESGSRRKTHTLVFRGDSLRFAEPWWLGAGLRALEIPDPVLHKVSASQLADSANAPTVSSTPSRAGKMSSAPRIKR